MSQCTNKTLYMYMHMNFIYRQTCTIYDYDVRFIVKRVLLVDNMNNQYTIPLYLEDFSYLVLSIIKYFELGYAIFYLQ